MVRGKCKSFDVKRLTFYDGITVPGRHGSRTEIRRVRGTIEYQVNGSGGRTAASVEKEKRDTHGKCIKVCMAQPVVSAELLRYLHVLLLVGHLVVVLLQVAA